MGDGRLQDGDEPESVHRRDGTGRRDALPRSESNRGNKRPQTEDVTKSEEALREVDSADGGRKIQVVETSGIAVAEHNNAE